MSFFLVDFLLLLSIMIFQKGSYLRLGQVFSLAAILIAVIIDGLLVTTKFARPRSHIIAIGFPVSLFAVGLSISEIQEAYYTKTNTGTSFILYPACQ